jgi:hypothetical protein
MDIILYDTAKSPTPLDLTKSDEDPISFTPVGNEADLTRSRLTRRAATVGLGRLGCPTPGAPGAIDHQALLGRQRDEGALRGGKWCLIPQALPNVFDVPVLPIISAVILRQEYVLKHGPQLLDDHPQQDPRLG